LTDQDRPEDRAQQKSRAWIVDPGTAPRMRNLQLAAVPYFVFVTSIIPDQVAPFNSNFFLALSRVRVARFESDGSVKARRTLVRAWSQLRGEDVLDDGLASGKSALAATLHTP